MAQLAGTSQRTDPSRHVPQLVTMQSRHIPSLISIEQECGFPPAHQAKISSLLDDKKLVRTVAEIAGEAYGFIVTEQVAMQIHVHHLAVAPSHWREGIGRLLLSEALSVLAPGGSDERVVVIDVPERFIEFMGFLVNKGFVNSRAVHLRNQEGEDETFFRMLFSHSDRALAKLRSGIPST